MSARKQPTDGESGLRKLGSLAMASPPVLMIVVFVGLPVLNAIGFSFGFTGGLNSAIALAGRQVHSTTTFMPNLGAYRDVLNSQRFREDLSVTLMITVVVTVVVLAMAWTAALLMRLRPNAITRLLPIFLVVPMFIPGVIGAWALLNFWSADGFVGSLVSSLGGRPPQLGFSTPMVIIAQIWGHLPFATLLVSSGVAGVPDALIEAARDAGASTWRVVRSIILPLALMPTVIAATFTAIGLVGSFTIPYLDGPNSPSMLGVTMTRTFQSYGQPQQSVVMAIIVFILASGVGAIYVWMNWRSSRSQL